MFCESVSVAVQFSWRLVVCPSACINMKLNGDNSSIPSLMHLVSDEEPLRNRSERSTSAKYEIRKNESTWSQLHKTSKIITKLLLSTKLCVLDKITFFLCESWILLDFRVDLRSDNDMYKSVYILVSHCTAFVHQVPFLQSSAPRSA